MKIKKILKVSFFILLFICLSTIQSHAASVKNQKNNEIYVEKLLLSTSNISLKEGKNKKITPTIVPNNASNKKIAWTSSNTKVATVDSSGKIKGISKGKATITAKTTDGSNLKQTLNITVTVPVTGIELSENAINLAEDSTSLTATVKPSNATNKNIKWTSSNSDIATVDSNGKITAKAPGTTSIIATSAENSKIKAVCEVNVVNNILFIGNSKTYYNRMPTKIFAKIATQAGKNVHVEQITSAGKTLYWHATNSIDKISQKINERRWDYVVLQEQTTTAYNDFDGMKNGITTIVNLMRTKSPNIKIIYNSIWMDITDVEDKSKEGGRTEIINKTGLIYKIQRKANDNYRTIRATKGLEGTIAYSGKAFIWCWRDSKGKNIQLYRANCDNDWNHPSPAGSFLESCCIYSAIFGTPSNDVIIDKAWNYKPGNIDEEYDISEKTQKILWKITRQVM